jgi:hypothetical protein
MKTVKSPEILEHLKTITDSQRKKVKDAEKHLQESKDTLHQCIIEEFKCKHQVKEGSLIESHLFGRDLPASSCIVEGFVVEADGSVTIIVKPYRYDGKNVSQIMKSIYSWKSFKVIETGVTSANEGSVKISNYKNNCQQVVLMEGYKKQPTEEQWSRFLSFMRQRKETDPEGMSQEQLLVWYHSLNSFHVQRLLDCNDLPFISEDGKDLTARKLTALGEMYVVVEGELQRLLDKNSLINKRIDKQEQRREAQDAWDEYVRTCNPDNMPNPYAFVQGYLYCLRADK